MTPPILELRGVEYSYGPFQALRGADLAVRRGRRLAVMGANGAGKTTLLMLLPGLVRPDRGTVLLDGASAGYSRSALAAWRRRVGLVLQDPDDQLFAATIVADVSFGPLNLGLPEAEVRTRVEESLRRMGLWSLRDRPAHAVSLGQKKRAALAGVLAMRPEVLVLDEPTAGLDPLSRRELLAALGELHAQGAAMVMATHDADLAWSWADEVALVRAGRVLVQGPAPDVLRDEAVLAEAGLLPPLVPRLAHALGRLGIPLPELLPGTADGLLELLGQVGARGRNLSG